LLLNGGGLMGYHKKAHRALESGRKLLEKRSRKGKEGLKKRTKKVLAGL